MQQDKKEMMSDISTMLHYQLYILAVYFIKVIYRNMKIDIIHLT